tara:strand:+ start:622 stop:735 length:114 start_codon:yes stop_codon:yes gene_type:complete
VNKPKIPLQAYPELSTKKTTEMDLNDLGMLGEELGEF